MKKGYIQIYKGNGKGKTSALNGMALRGCGAGFKVVIHRFLKNRPTSEDKVFNKLNIKVNSLYNSSTKFIWEMNEDEIKVFKDETIEGYNKFISDIKSGDYDVVLADELLGAVENLFIEKQTLINDLTSKAVNTEIIITGRKSFKELDDLADLISTIEPTKHYYEKNVPARKGIEL